MPLDGRGGYTHNQTRAGESIRVAREGVSSGPFYYDGSEQFEREEFTDPELQPMPTGPVQLLKTVPQRAREALTPPRAVIQRKASTATPPRIKHGSSGIASLEAKSARVSDVAELPASPVGRRITRDLVKKALEPASTTGDIGSSVGSPATQGNDNAGRASQDQVTTGLAEDEMSASSTLPTRTNNRHSILSQVGSSVLDSDTLDLAKSTYIPALTGTGPANGPASGTESASASPGSPEKSTEDGMTDLLANYEHTNSKQGGEVSSDVKATHNSDVVAKSRSERKANHAQTSSDEESFKSCTDVLEPVSPGPSKDEDAKSGEIATDTKGQLPAKDSDARSFQTCKDVNTPGRSSSRAQSQLPTTSSANLDLRTKTPASDKLSSSPIRTFMRKALPRDSSLSIRNKLRRSSRPSIKHESVSVSGSSSTLGAQQPPQVPPRESSASVEAQRQRGVSSFLMRWKRPKNVISEQGVAVRDSIEDQPSESAPQDEEATEPDASVQEPQDVPETPENTVTTPEPVPEEQNSSLPIEPNSPSEPLRVGITMVPDMHHRAFSSPSAGYHVPSSIYSPQDISLKTRTHSSPADIPVSPESSRRHSQSTTHLSWVGRKPYADPSASASEPHLPLPSVQENTTTDLRLSGYRYNYPPQRLPDLKEESHEDSSLNTSASNLKNSHFRFPYGGGPGMRTSVDDAVLLSRRSSTRSYRRSAVGEVHGLPSLEFSQNNLFEKFKDALGDIRFSRSLDLAEFEKGSPQRSLSDGDLHEKFRGSVNLVGEVKKFGESSQPTGVIDFAKLKRECPPELMEEIDRLSIPSVTQLTQHFSELLPSLSLGEHKKEHGQGECGDSVEFPEEQEIMEHALEEIHEVHPPSQKRSSARLRPVRGSSALMVIDDDVFEELASRAKGRGGASSSGQEVVALASGVGEAGTRAPGQNNDVPHTPTRQLSPIAELQPPSPAALRPRSHTAGDEHLRISVESALSARRSLRSFVSTPTATATVTRPWNFDENYPWATTTPPSVNISLPPTNTVKSSPRPGPSHLRNALSDATTSTFTSARTATASPTGNTSSSNANRQSHRLSIFGRSGDQAHAVGERYPTSALSPPTTIFRDNLSACETSDDEDFTTSRKTRLSLRKRFSSAARNNTTVYTPPRVTRSKVNPAELASPASAHENSSSTLQDRQGEARAFTSNRHTFRDAEGMRASAYHRQRLIDSVKRWWSKGAKLIRTISRRDRN